MTLEEIKRRKKEYGYSNEQMAKLSGLPLSTVQKVLGGTTKAPRYATLLALSSIFPKEPVLLPDPNAPLKPVYPVRKPDPDFLIVREAPVPYGRASTIEEIEAANRRDEAQRQTSERYPCQGSYTLEDYLALSDDLRPELIDGIFYDMASPSTQHQIIGGDIYYELKSFIRSKGGDCVPFMSPVDVQLDLDNKTIVQPDVTVICDRSKIISARILGAPDLIVEVLSPGTRHKDTFIKLPKYAKAGVREYWIVDPIKERVLKFVFSSPGGDDSDDIIPAIYGLQDKVPVSIFKDECVIDFAKISQNFAFIKVKSSEKEF